MAQDKDAPRVAADTAAATEAELRRRRALAEALEQQSKPPPATRPRTATIGAIAAGVAVAAAVTWAVVAGIGGSGDHVSDADKAAWAAEWAAAAPQVTTRVAPADIPAALAAMHLTPETQTEVQTALDGGRSLVYMTFTDVVNEDGDQVRLDTGDFQTLVTIFHQPTKVYFPEPPGGVVNVTGTIDGGGGITIAITSGEAPVNLPFMEVGQTVGIPVVVSP